jgi:hypothetical protein
MPRLGGDELLLEIDRDRDLRGLAVLVITGATEELDTAGRPVLHKPFGGSLLRTYVQELLSEPRRDGAS